MWVVTGCGGGQASEPQTGSEPGTSSEAGTGSEEGQGEPASSGEEARDNEFQIQRSDTAGQAHGVEPSRIEANETHAAMRLFVVDPETGPIQGVVVKMTNPEGYSYYTEESDSVGYAEVLVPAGQRYEMEYLSLGRRNTTAAVEVPQGRNQDIRLTLRYRRRPPPEAGRVVLDGVFFDTNRATIQEASFPRLDRVAEYMTHRPSVRIRVGGHTDNVGNARRNQRLSEQRAQAVRDYLVSKGIDPSRIEAVGYGDQNPVASNDTEEGRAENRRIEAIEL
jgi:outer membrane protein OmpA-like peptidoglycan-associated protein